jgi:hypothetical protein
VSWVQYKAMYPSHYYNKPKDQVLVRILEIVHANERSFCPLHEVQGLQVLINSVVRMAHRLLV